MLLLCMTSLADPLRKLGSWILRMQQQMTWQILQQTVAMIMVVLCQNRQWVHWSIVPLDVEKVNRQKPQAALLWDCTARSSIAKTSHKPKKVILFSMCKHRECYIYKKKNVYQYSAHLLDADLREGLFDLFSGVGNIKKQNHPQYT